MVINKGGHAYKAKHFKISLQFYESLDQNFTCLYSFKCISHAESKYDGGNFNLNV